MSLVISIGIENLLFIGLEKNAFMNEKLGSRQLEMLNLLLRNKAGLSIDEFAGELNISRNAVQRHLGNLERLGYVGRQAFKQTGGRPVRLFVLTKAGINSFPKQYAWFCRLIIDNLIKRIGSDNFKNYLNEMGISLSQKLLPELIGMQLNERIDELLRYMNKLGFQANIKDDLSGKYKMIIACNCIYHELAQNHPEICQFDRALITSLIGRNIDHVESMAQNSLTCCFKIPIE